ncbi:MAG: peptidase S8, partial [Ignavibacteria bacterium CG08_land_8_20_14_0_20_37_9]
EYSLESNYPNPFNPTTSFSYSIKEMGLVTLKIFDVLGREVSVLVNEIKEPGKYSINFDASKLSSGVYIYLLSAGNFISSKKMILTK